MVVQKLTIGLLHDWNWEEWEGNEGFKKMGIQEKCWEKIQNRRKRDSVKRKTRKTGPRIVKFM